VLESITVMWITLRCDDCHTWKPGVIPAPAGYTSRAETELDGESAGG
jgi:hypothetical protein